MKCSNQQCCLHETALNIKRKHTCKEMREGGEKAEHKLTVPCLIHKIINEKKGHDYRLDCTGILTIINSGYQLSKKALVKRKMVALCWVMELLRC